MKKEEIKEPQSKRIKISLKNKIKSDFYLSSLQSSPVSILMISCRFSTNTLTKCRCLQLQLIIICRALKLQTLLLQLPIKRTNKKKTSLMSTCQISRLLKLQRVQESFLEPKVFLGIQAIINLSNIEYSLIKPLNNPVSLKKKRLFQLSIKISKET